MTDFRYKYLSSWYVFINLHSGMVTSNFIISKCLLTFYLQHTQTDIKLSPPRLLTFHTFIYRLVVWKCSCLWFRSRLNKKYSVWLKQNDNRAHYIFTGQNILHELDSKQLESWKLGGQGTKYSIRNVMQIQLRPLPFLNTVTLKFKRLNHSNLTGYTLIAQKCLFSKQNFQRKSPKISK